MIVNHSRESEMKKIKLGVAAVALMASAVALAKGGAQDCLAGRTDKDIPDYAPGETMTFTVETRGFEGADLAHWKIGWERTADDGRKESGEAPADRPFVYRTSLDRPGFVRLTGSLIGADGKPVKKSGIRGKTVSVQFDLGAGVEILKIRQAVPAPADFDALWAKHKANLATVAWKDGVQLKEIASPTAGVRLYEFSIPCYGGKPATGHLAVPEKEGRYPVTLKFFGYYESWTFNRAIAPPSKLDRNQISMFVSAHGFEMGHDEAYYRAERAKVKSNGFGHGFDPEQNADPEKTYYAGMTYRILRALEYVKTRPEWNGKDIVVRGGSQGGLQSIWAAALDHDVTACDVSIPWNCDIGGTELGRNRGDWYVKWVPALGYYDTCSMAPRIPKTCRVTVSMAGLGDYTCPPTGVMAFYNALTCPKSILFVQNARHGSRLQGEPVQRFRIDGDKVTAVGK